VSLHIGHVIIHKVLHGVLYPEAHNNGFEKNKKTKNKSRESLDNKCIQLWLSELYFVSNYLDILRRLYITHRLCIIYYPLSYGYHIRIEVKFYTASVMTVLCSVAIGIDLFLYFTAGIVPQRSVQKSVNMCP